MWRPRLRLAAPGPRPAGERAEVLRRAPTFTRRFGPIFAFWRARRARPCPTRWANCARRWISCAITPRRRSPLDARAGVFACISPWNFPLAIFTGQIAAALAAGNAVLAKARPQTPLIAPRGRSPAAAAGVPATALQLLPGGATVGAALTRDPRVAGVAFTGSTATAQAIRRAMADHLDPTAPLIAETGGLNAMVVDSTALPEQAVRDILASAFQSAGPALFGAALPLCAGGCGRTVTEMLFGAMDDWRWAIRGIWPPTSAR
jgi:RHH-type transcriptional regulator, proline utilization regulon repressor / proline dehydrogenase / delta 1-pyrroline-5-carboxylate dehydrogenase